MGTIINKFLARLGDILSTVFGWITGVIIFLFNVFLQYISGHETCIFIVLFVVVLDAFWGIARAIQDAKYTTSALMRDSISKLAVYGTLILSFIGFDKIGGFDSSLTVALCCALIVLVEVYSIMGNIIIVYPDFPVLKIFRRFLVGEIASKLGVDPQQVEEVLNQKGKDNEDTGRESC